MVVKRSLGQRIRGWYPQEPVLVNTATPQMGSNTSHRRITLDITLFVCVFATVVLSTAAAYGLGLGNITGAAAATTGIIAAIAVNVKFNAPNQKLSLTEEGKKIARIIGWANAGMLYLLLGTYFLVNPNIESAEVTLGLWVALLFSMFAVNSLLVRRLKKQMAPLEGM